MLMDAIGNTLKEGQLVRVELQGGGSVIGRVSRVEQGGQHTLVTPATKDKVQPALVVVDTQVPTMGAPNGRMHAILVLTEPPLPGVN